MQLYLSIREIASAFMVMFAIIDITGSTPVILDLQAKGKKIEAGKAAIGSFLLFMFFLFTYKNVRKFKAFVCVLMLRIGIFAHEKKRIAIFCMRVLFDST